MFYSFGARRQGRLRSAMGCGSSDMCRRSGNTSSIDAEDTKGKDYDYIRKHINLFPRGPPRNIVGIIERAHPLELEPRNPAKRPLLAIAIDHDEWFRWVPVVPILTFDSSHAPPFPERLVRGRSLA